ncbi:MAPEG family protein [Leptolyngbya sp. NIES-2104]|uniref:MAPEG family protein n=1 Tax=Leptolyngbya sp. NIES-2104 TaxID=1552121 RepID=UPI0006EC6CB8|nr:MAPEG family protein [Leptolyngbya sp. NIES-2104]GAP98024.1 probable membrane protein STY2112 [Leptolyngbya sp. NIES-2104]
MLITSIYAAILGLVFAALSIRTLLLRRQLGVAIGDGDQAALARAIRVHANFAEYVPLSLILIYFSEIQMQTSLWIHLLCSALVIGRIIHAIGVSQVKENFRYRVIGMGVTFTVMISASIGLMISGGLHLGA